MSRKNTFASLMQAAIDTFLPKRALVAAELERDCRRTDRWIAERCGVGLQLVAQVRRLRPEWAAEVRYAPDGTARRMRARA